MLNGIFACQNRFLITNVLKRDWGWPGFIETDFAADHDGVQAALARLDIDMPGGSFAQMTSANLLSLYHGWAEPADSTFGAFLARRSRIPAGTQAFA